MHAQLGCFNVPLASGLADCRNTAPWCAFLPCGSSFLLACHQLHFETGNLRFVYTRTACVRADPFIGKIQFRREQRTWDLPGIPEMVPFGVFNSTLPFNSALMLWEVVCAFLQDLSLAVACGRKKCL